MKKLTILLTIICLGLLVVLGVMMNDKLRPSPAVSAISRDGVISEIHKMGRLQSVAFGVDTVITAQKTGTWQKLWQDEQKGLFVAKGRVLAGIDLNKITPQMVEVVFKEQTDPKIPPHANINITLPPAEIFEVFLDDIQIYDWQTGLFGVVDNDPQLLTQAQTSAKNEVLNKACTGDIIKLATDNAREQIQGLFMLTKASVHINTQTGECRKPL